MTTPPHRIARPQPARLHEAIQLLLGSDRKRAERFLRHVRATRMSLEHLLCSHDAEARITATVLASVNPGRTSTLFATSPPAAEIGTTIDGVSKAHAAAIGALIDACCIQLQRNDIRLAQALLEPQEQGLATAFKFGGFKQIALLEYMERSTPVCNSIDAGSWPMNVNVTTFDPSDVEARQRLEDLLLHTAQDTLDCPALCGLRTGADILSGHMHSGIFQPKWWTILREGERELGVALFNGSTGTSSIELVYLGIIPEARGRGFGRGLLQAGLCRVAGAREKRIVLAVDQANEPAISIYKTWGFRTTTSRYAFIRSLPELTV